MADTTPAVSFPRLASRGVLLGLSRIQVGLVAVALVVFVLAEFTRGAAGVVAALPLWLGPMALALVPLRGRPLVEWIPVAATWVARRQTGTSSQRVKPMTQSPSSLTIPGCRSLAVAQTPELGVGVVHDASDSTLTAVLPVGTEWLDELVDLLNEKRQVILYGPPGTGKTYLAQKVANAVAPPENVRLVQFHPAYAYEDFFEGYRPAKTDGGQVRVRPQAGTVPTHRRGRPRAPRAAVRPHHRRDQPGQPRQGLRRAVLLAGVPRRSHQPALRRGRCRSRSRCPRTST